MNKKVVVGMSGGVDSSVAAFLLKQQGWDVIGVTMQIWQDEDLDAVEDNGGCCGITAVTDARLVAQKLDIPYYVLNFKEDFKNNVIDYFVNEYIGGRTPNPCIACNRYVKWESLLQKAIGLGASHIATGHYAICVVHHETGRYTLKKSVTEAKDQTYALYNLTQEQLSHTLMPVGEYTKDEIRAIAERENLINAHKPDSQEICFIPDNDYGNFIVNQGVGAFPVGDFVDVNGKVLGKHRGIIYYTVGQRKGLGIAFGKPMYVKEIIVAENKVVLAEDAQLFTKELKADNVSFMAIDQISAPIKAKAKIRYSHKGADCTVSMVDGRLEIVFDEAQRAVTPGQAVVVYDQDHILCGGVII